MVTFNKFNERVSKYDTSVIQEVKNRDFAMKYFIIHWDFKIRELKKNGINI